MAKRVVLKEKSANSKAVPTPAHRSGRTLVSFFADQKQKSKQEAELAKLPSDELTDEQLARKLQKQLNQEALEESKTRNTIQKTAKRPLPTDFDSDPGSAHDKHAAAISDVPLMRDNVLSEFLKLIHPRRLREPVATFLKTIPALPITTIPMEEDEMDYCVLSMFSRVAEKHDTNILIAAVNAARREPHSGSPTKTVKKNVDQAIAVLAGLVADNSPDSPVLRGVNPMLDTFPGPPVIPNVETKTTWASTDTSIDLA
jgi:hypothetical protein